MFIPSKK